MSSSSPISPPTSSFTPRKEFLRDQQGVRNSFALLAISGPNCVRLYSFTPQTVQILRRVLEQYAPITSIREDAVQNLCEFALDKKPWANPKSVPSEKLLVDIIAAIYQSGYTFLSSIDYGREADDRLALAFSRPDAAAHPPSRSASPLPVSSLHARNDSSHSTLSGGGRPPARRVPFAISFSSVTMMRVIAPPLHLTPAILQACRGSWPRGVVSEKKVYQNSYEFKLKGYGLFQQDTFATDSLNHILSLLASLDAHSFSLLTSVSLTPSHSRVKDLWIFTGPATEDTLAELNSQSLLDINPITRLSLNQSHDTHGSHKRQATEPAPAAAHSPIMTGHGRSASESPHRSPASSTPSNVLRKGAPRAQIPVSVRGSEILDDVEAAPLRTYLPSVVASDVDNMTGVGSGQSPAIFYETSPLDIAGAQVAQAQAAQHSRYTTPPAPVYLPHTSPTITQQSTPTHHQTSLSSPSTRTKTPTPPVPSTPSPPASPANSQPGTPVAELNPSSPLLGASAFRDSAFSSATEFSREISIKWTGPLTDDLNPDKLDPPKPKQPSRLSSSPMIPGGWQPTPISEKANIDLDAPSEGTPIHENDKRIEAPAIVKPEFELRRSEAALVGVIKSTSPSPAQLTPQLNEGAAGGGTGWVLVNVDTPKANMLGEAKPLPTSHPSESSTDSSNTALAATVPHHPTPEAKAIAIVDAMEAKNKKSSTKKDESSMKRFFSISRKNSSLLSTIQRSTLRDRLRRIGTPEAPRREDKRRSID
ncbi:hypothetical protein CPB83DRAFT_865982 [Crepidotus variabilis]|uniref:Uncharacterized protein n=1 Tax=Crepidotus variabilis TaxID=179855 RepID=A0A9P6EVP5_9AGAR|nr:hypothetical protein CPB83DRAFT_865982 [Crepidotus variabilis]